MMPKFKLQRRMRKYGNSIRRVESLVIVIKCALKDAPYLKTMLTYGYETGQIQVGDFVLSGIHLSADVGKYKMILRDQNSFIDLVAAVVINSLTEGAVQQKVNYQGKQTQLGNVF
eukprot:12156052-Ditylum_brightwellii.AAC.1